MFSMLSNKVVQPINEEDNLILKCSDEKVILILDYLYMNTNRKNIIKFNINNMVEECYYKPNPNKNKMNDVFKNILIKLIELKIVKDITVEEMQKAKANTFLICKLNMLEQDKDGNYTKFFTLKEEEKQKIMVSKRKGIENIKVLALFCYLKSRMRKSNIEDIRVVGRSPLSCFPSYNAISKDLGINEGVIKKYLELLVELNLIRYENTGAYKKGNKVREGVNNYVLYQQGWENELEYALKFYDERMKKKGYDYLEESVGIVKRKLGGEKGRITRLKNNGQATKRQLKKLDKIEEMLNMDTDLEKLGSYWDTPEEESNNINDVATDNNEKDTNTITVLRETIHNTTNRKKIVDDEYLQLLNIYEC